MPQTSKEMLENAKKHIEQKHKDLELQKEELNGLKNELKVEEQVLEEIKSDKDLSLFQQGAMTGVLSEIELKNQEIKDTEMEIKLLAKKIEILQKDN